MKSLLLLHVLQVSQQKFSHFKKEIKSIAPNAPPNMDPYKLMSLKVCNCW